MIASTVSKMTKAARIGAAKRKPAVNRALPASTTPRVKTSMVGVVPTGKLW